MEFLNKITDDTVRAEVQSEINKLIETERNTTVLDVETRYNKQFDTVYEKEIKPVFGIEKLPNEKPIDFQKRLAAEIKVKHAEEINQYKTDLETLKKQGFTDEQVKAEYESAKQKIADYSTQLQAIQTEKSEMEKRHKIELYDKEINIAYTSQVPKFPDTVNTYEAQAKDKEFKQKLKEKYNVSIDDNGILVAESKENYAKMSVSEIFKSEFANYFTENKQNFNPEKPKAPQGELRFSEGMTQIQKNILVESFVKNKYNIDKYHPSYGEKFNLHMSEAMKK